MDAYLYLNSIHSKDCLKKWCKHYGYVYDSDKKIVTINNSSYYLCEEFDEECFADDLFPPHGIDINYNIYMDIIGKNDFQKTIEGICIFFSLTSFVCKSTSSDVLMYFEGGSPLVYRRNGDIILSDQIVNKPYYTRVIKNFDGMDHIFDDIEKYFID